MHVPEIVNFGETWAVTGEDLHITDSILKSSLKSAVCMTMQSLRFVIVVAVPRVDACGSACSAAAGNL